MSSKTKAPVEEFVNSLYGKVEVLFNKARD